jgi:hypothetical protein
MAQPKAYEMIMDSIKEFNKTSSWTMNPSSTKKGNVEYLGEIYILHWTWTKWYRSFKDVESVLENLRLNHDEEEGFGYKQVILNQDNSTEESSNMMDLDSYLYPVCDVELDIGNAVLEEV